MALSLVDTADLVARCAPGVAPETLVSIVAVESGFEPLAIGVNGTPRITLTATSPSEATAKAVALIGQGRSLDLGLAQINSRNLAPLGLTVAAAFDPCLNLAASAKLLVGAYGRSGADQVGVQAALRRTLSYYNTGDPARGAHNGYIDKVVGAARYVVPALATTLAPDPRAATHTATPSPTPRAPWDVFGQTPPAAFVIRPQPGAQP